MSIIDVIFLALVAASAAASRNSSRGLLWLACMTAAYFVSGIWWRAGMDNGQLVAGLCDAAVALLAFFIARQRWEMYVFGAFLLMLAINFAYALSNIIAPWALTHETYSIALEVVNAVTIVGIGGIAAFQGAGFTSGPAFDPWVSIFGFVRPFRSKVAQNAWKR